MVRVRFAPSPTGSLHLGGALTAVANRRFADDHGGTFVLRIDDTDATRTDSASEQAIVADLEWLGITIDEGPVRQSDRSDLYRAAAERLRATDAAAPEADGALRFRGPGRPTLLRGDGSATYQLASVVDDVDLAITHVIRGKDHLANTAVQRALAEALGAAPPEYVHHGLLLDPDGGKLSKRHRAASVAELRERGVPAEAVRAYLEELDLPRSDVQLDLARIRRFSVDALGALSDAELAARVGAPVTLAPSLRGAHDLVEAREIARAITERTEHVSATADERPTLERFREARAAANGDLDPERAKALVAGLRADGADLRALRRALTGADRGPELWTIVLALPRDEALRRIDAALG
ncbi:MAG: hypothetical protein KY396_04175 [Actinobacteria bacterium]|nr:hypothetical protein [Actinomycetota bacterium]